MVNALRVPDVCSGLPKPLVAARHGHSAVLGLLFGTCHVCQTDAFLVAADLPCAPSAAAAGAPALGAPSSSTVPPASSAPADELKAPGQGIERSQLDVARLQQLLDYRDRGTCACAHGCRRARTRGLLSRVCVVVTWIACCVCCWLLSGRFIG